VDHLETSVNVTNT